MTHEPDTKVLDGEAARPSPESTVASGIKRVGRYELVQRLGHGGMATVFLGRATGQAGFEKLVAVKVIHPHLALEDEVLEMFLREARIAARIHHPNVVETIDLGEDDGTPFMVLELVDGEPLSSLMRAQRPEPFSLGAVAQLLADACAGLAAAHSLAGPSGEPQGLVHRDISPQNLLIRHDGWLKIADFGIAKAADRAGHTRPGQLRGKLAYMSPEQARGEPVDLRTDLFALGVIGWELVTGERLFARDTDTLTLKRVVECEIPPLDLDLPGLAGESKETVEAFVEVLRQALQRDREDRFESAAQMGEVLRKILRRCEEDDPRARLADSMRQHFGKRAAYLKTVLRESNSFPAVPAALASDGEERSQTVEVGRSLAAEAVVGAGETETPLDDTAENPPVETTATATGLTPAPRHWASMLVWPAAAAAVAIAVISWRAVDDKDTPAAVPPAAEAQDVRWYVTTTPEGASVVLDGEELESLTPTQVELPKGETPVTLELRLAGYEDIEVQLAPLSDQNLPYRMTRLQPVSTLPLEGAGIQALPAATRTDVEAPEPDDANGNAAGSAKGPGKGTRSGAKKKTKKKTVEPDPFMGEPTFED